MRKFFLILGLLLPSVLHAQYYPVSGYCVQGATTAAVSGLQSTNYQQGIVPGCTITVYFAGTSTAVPGSQIFSNTTGTVLGNPFTASATGMWIFFASNASQYTVVGSGGTPPNNYPSPVTLATVASVSAGAIYLPLAGGTLYGSLFAPNVNGEIYPAACGDSSPPSWCSGTTADAWYRAACTQLPSTGGIINLLGLKGTIAASMTCSTPTKQVITLEDPTSLLTVTEADGGIVFPQDNGSMFLGPGVGQCPYASQGIHLGSSASVAAIVGPAHTDGTQEALTANGLCLWGAAGATVSKGLMWADRVFTNTSFNNNNVQICPTACVLVQDVGGSMTVNGNLLNALAGANTITDSTLIIQAVTAGNAAIEVAGNSIQGANGGAGHSEIQVIGNGAGVVNEGIWIHNDYIERAGYAGTTGDVVGIQITDCQGCKIQDILGLGTSGGTDFINVGQSGGGLTQNVTIENVLANSWTNVLNDTIAGVVFPHAESYNLAHYVVNSGFSDLPCSPLSTFPGSPYMGQCWTTPPGYRQSIATPIGVQQYAWLSDTASAIASLGPDFMSGAGSFTTGSANFGTGFVGSGCLTGEGLSCTFTRTNSTAPPNGSTYSQEVQITANTDPSIGFNGVEYSTQVSFTAGQPYRASFWAKGDGSFTGVPTFLLWNPVTPVTYCLSTGPGAFSSTWTLYTFLCVPSASGSSYLSISAETPLGATGSFWIGSFTFAQVVPLTVGSDLVAIGPYAVGAALPFNAATRPLPTCNSSSNAQKFTVSDATSPTYLGTYTSGGAVVAPVVCNGTNWVTY